MLPIKNFITCIKLYSRDFTLIEYISKYHKNTKYLQYFLIYMNSILIKGQKLIYIFKLNEIRILNQY